ncbi:MAG: hypothetical protein PGN16_17340 [Sphingomonas phyllosphaerae]|uniref:hypothetical protein n=1 Tax=Sphingomonas phyllosphaerae TaxID=257003 RepID=UPI002FFA7CD3
MATHALSPALPPANNDRATFNLALARYADATAARDALPCPSPIERELAAGDAVDFATKQLAAAPAPDLSAFATKLRVILADLGTPPLVAECLTVDVRRLARGEARA